MIRSPALFVSLALVAAAPVAAAPVAIGLGAFAPTATLVDFNTIAAGESVSNQFAAQGVSFSAPLFGYPDQNGLFGGDPMQVLNSTIPFDCGVAGNCVAITLTFAQAIYQLGFDLATNPGVTTLVNGFGSVDFATSPGTTFLGIQDSTGFTSVTISVAAGNGAFIMDNLRFTQVPEPASLALVGLALAAAGLTRRRS